MVQNSQQLLFVVYNIHGGGVSTLILIRSSSKACCLKIHLKVSEFKCVGWLTIHYIRI